MPFSKTVCQQFVWNLQQSLRQESELQSLLETTMHVKTLYLDWAQSCKKKFSSNKETNKGSFST